MQNSTQITVKSAFETLTKAGYPRSYVSKLLPDWWDNSLFSTSAGAFQFSLILKQRLGLDVSFEKDGNLVINTGIGGARFKHGIDTRAEELSIAANLGLAIARLAIYCSKIPFTHISFDPAELHDSVLRFTKQKVINFMGLLDFCWAHGIPVLYLKEMPRQTKRMTGMAVMVENRPAILLGYNYSQHARQLFVLAHEIGHIACNHVAADSVIVDENIIEVSDALAGSTESRKDSEEKEADAFALHLIRNGVKNPMEHIGKHYSASTLASRAVSIGQKLGIDPGHLILSYAKENDEWAKANQALNFLPGTSDGIKLVNDRFLENTHLSCLSDENSEYLKQMQGIKD